MSVIVRTTSSRTRTTAVQTPLENGSKIVRKEPNTETNVHSSLLDSFGWMI